MVEFPKHAQRQKDMPDEEDERELEEVKGEAWTVERRNGTRRKKSGRSEESRRETIVGGKGGNDGVSKSESRDLGRGDSRSFFL